MLKSSSLIVQEFTITQDALPDTLKQGSSQGFHDGPYCFSQNNLRAASKYKYLQFFRVFSSLHFVCLSATNLVLSALKQRQCILSIFMAYENTKVVVTFVIFI